MSDSQSFADVASSTTAAALSSLHDVLDAFNQFPCIKYLASVAVKTLETIDVRFLFIHIFRNQLTLVF